METVLVPAPPSLQDAYSNQPVPKQASPPRRTSSGKARLLCRFSPMHVAASMASNHLAARNAEDAGCGALGEEQGGAPTLIKALNL